MIQLLPPQLANQIAAGEVVERPASVVKELVENCIDAGATKIEIDITQGGHKQILIRDNGSGIAKAQLTLALSRHATSKITCLDDLEAISSMGFRGEALASISAVSRLTLTSKTADQSEAWQACAQGMDMAVDIVPAAHPNGTTIDVQDLFFNTPARRRFLRTEKTEFGHIEAVFKRIAMAHPKIEFLLRHNGKRVKHCRVTENPILRIGALHSALHEDMLWPLDVESNGVSLTGLILDPSVNLSATTLHYSFVNQRPMRDKLITHAIRQAYELSGCDPENIGFVLFVNVDPHAVDVNVHPAKHEVRFHDARQVHDFISSAFRKVLLANIPHGNGDDSVLHVNEIMAAAANPSHDYIQPPRAQQGILRNAGSGQVSRTEGYSNSRPPLQKTSTTPWAGTEPTITDHAAFLALDADTCLMRTDDCALWFIRWSECLKARLQSELSAATRAQPLLIPVAIPVCKAWSEAKRQTLEKLHIVVEQIASKLILKQVPSGWRAMPWSNAFSVLIDTTDEISADTVIARLCEFMQSESPFQSQQTMQWFLQLDKHAQNSVLSQSAKRIDITQLEHMVSA
ncbi:DNA mismatch repair endonuclease MutL [Alteromonas oceanisediminis]|uniref:DNA mismatch repair endonuclease MutL n=1 Tax=Alteromonas oceanisediminis TaxID=2836180 RepID=UPI001BDA2D58|nr:DNA mismatch repair endonuclease MutL [Alteromonas oceanisediminis]MBT0586933.1 DNA mismatch repair endonuclease MutL [Alteromonas oceanisediminis]